MCQDWNKVRAVECVWAHSIAFSSRPPLSLAVGPHGGSHSDTCHHSALNISAGESLIRLQNEEFVGATTKPEMYSNFSYMGARGTVLYGLLKAIFFIIFFVSQEHHTDGFGKIELRWGDLFCNRKIPNSPVCWNDIHVIYYWTITDIFCMFCFLCAFWQNNAFNA